MARTKRILSLLVAMIMVLTSGLNVFASTKLNEVPEGYELIEGTNEKNDSFYYYQKIENTRINDSYRLNAVAEKIYVQKKVVSYHETYDNHRAKSVPSVRIHVTETKDGYTYSGDIEKYDWEGQYMDSGTFAGYYRYITWYGGWIYR